MRTLPASVCFISKCQELESPFTDLFIHSCFHISVTFTYFPFSKRPRIIVVSDHVILQIFEIITFWFVYWLGSHLNTSDSCKLYHRMSWKNVSVTYCHVKNTPKFSALKEWHYLFCSHICLGGLSGNSSEGGGRFAGLAVNAGLCCQCHQPSTYMCPLHMTWVPGLVTSDSEPSGSFITSKVTQDCFLYIPFIQTVTGSSHKQLIQVKELRKYTPPLVGECHCFRRAQRIENIASFLLRRCHLPSTIRLKLRSSSNDGKCHLPALEVRSQSGLLISSIPTLLTLEQPCPLTELLLPARKASNESSLPSTPGGCIPRHYWASRILFIIYFVPVVQKSLCVLDSSILTLYLPALCHKQGSETERRSQRF